MYSVPIHALQVSVARIDGVLQRHLPVIGGQKQVVGQVDDVVEGPTPKATGCTPVENRIDGDFVVSFS